MSGEEIKTECQIEYDKIKSAKERLEQLRNMCKHEETKEVNYSHYGDPSRARLTKICAYCNKPLPSSSPSS